LNKKAIVIFMSILLTIGILSGCTEEKKNAAPDAMFTYSGDYDYVDTLLTFTDESETDDDLTYLWDFGDGETSTEPNPTHTYTSEGEYIVNLTVTDPEEQTDYYTMDITITLMDIVTKAMYEEFNKLYDALDAASLVDTLSGTDEYTVFAPTDAAFEALNQTWLTDLLEDTTNLTNVLLYHVVEGKVMSTDLTNGSVMTLEKTNITVVVGDPVTINDVEVTSEDIECNNGVIHVIGEVLLPASVPGPED